MESSVVELRVNPRIDPNGAWLSRVITAAFAAEIATRRRRAWTAVVAAASVPAALALVFPGLLTPTLRRTEAAAWSVSVVALVAHLLAEVRAARTARRLRERFEGDVPRPSQQGMG
jgi:hypothetical protein